MHSQIHACCSTLSVDCAAPRMCCHPVCAHALVFLSLLGGAEQMEWATKRPTASGQPQQELAAVGEGGGAWRREEQLVHQVGCEADNVEQVRSTIRRRAQ